MEYAGNVTHREQWNETAILYAYMAGGNLYGYSFCVKPVFPYCKGINLFNYHGGCETLRMVDSILNPN